MNLDEVARKRQLDNILRLIRKHLGTMIILPLAEFEEAFGALWEEEQRWAEQWAHTRARILNRANGQSRLINELLGQLVTRLDNQ